MSLRFPLQSLAGRLSLAGVLLAAAPLLAACTPQVTVLTSRAADAEFHTVTVLGQGEVRAKPDCADAMLGVEVTAPTVAEATGQAASRMNAILSALKRSGIAEKDIETSNFSVNREQQPDYVGMPYAPMPMPTPMPVPTPPPPVAGPRGTPAPPPPIAPPPPDMMPPRPRLTEIYRVSNGVHVKIRDLTRVGAVLDAAIAAGANNIWGVQFAVEDTKALEAKAREKAAADARARAEALARLQGVSLAGVVSINETPSGGVPYPVPGMAPMMGMRDSASSPIAPGEVTFATQVQVVYALKGEAAAEATETPH